jgi:hypothetical protein
MKMKKSTFLLMAAMLLGSVGAWGQGVASYTMETSTEPWVSIAATGTQLTYVAADGGNLPLRAGGCRKDRRGVH